MTKIFPHVCCLQLEILLGKVRVNLNGFRKALAAEHFAENTLVVLPELWATGFDYSNCSSLAKQTPEILAELEQLAAINNLWFAGSLLEKSSTEKPYNTLFLVGPNGLAGTYRKQHLFRYWQEDKYLRSGKTSTPNRT
ncbi:MAG: nitrilase, partial [Candidatus Electrothrix sp. AR3]|nr:nitrilase [Candidatus Electrothrix sp. AR3]